MIYDPLSVVSLVKRGNRDDFEVRKKEGGKRKEGSEEEKIEGRENRLGEW